jgi:uroporphyrinogen decarboxylase
VTIPLLVRAARREPVERTPVWFMRQAGRSLSEYRELRTRYGLFEIARQPELCAEITLQPVRRLGVDAAVMFADIMLPVLGMGVEVELVENVGPVVGAPIRSARDVERLTVPEPEDAVPWVLDSVRLVRDALRDDQAVVGFAGGPFTVAGYLIEGKPTRDFKQTKACMYASPEVWHALMDKLAEAFGRYVAGCVRAGADAIQLFDSWVGALSVDDYREFVAPYSARVLEAVDAPTIHFATGDAHLLAERAAAGGDVISVDWRVPLDLAWEQLGGDVGIQGNLDPALLLGPWERVERGTLEILRRANGRPGHIFNLGHGVLPETDPADLSRLVELVHERTAVRGGFGAKESVPQGRAGRPLAASSVAPIAHSLLTLPASLPANDQRTPATSTFTPNPPSPMTQVAVVLMAYGSPPEPADIPAYFADIREGRPVSPEAIEELTERYRRIGGRSPLDEITEAQRAALERELRLPVFVGMKHWRPRIAEAVEAALVGGAETVVGLVLAPHYSALSIAGYRERIERALGGRAELVFVESWHDHDLFIDVLAGRVRGFDGHVVFTAHSLPERILRDGDPYRDQLLVAARAGLADWSFAFQSASDTGEPWLGPDILQELDTLAAKGVRCVLVCPVGFVSDHLEILWDLDVEAREKAKELGLELERIESLNDDARFIAALGALVRDNLSVPSIR